MVSTQVHHHAGQSISFGVKLTQTGEKPDNTLV